ncbi:MAG: error-prone DNA polymerase, partial [Pirellulaceae bacterium]|nr:error-prone DNA polymerase [Pirellulaceae bacterium]
AHAGLVKIDLLALGMLSAIQEAGDLLALRSVDFDMAQLTYDDPRVYDMVCAADTVGLFQIESRAQMNTLPRLRPRTFHDLVVEVALIRPGPIQGDMVHPYLRRREGLEEVTFPSEEVRGVLERTLGVPLFQEQAMQLAVVAAGFSPGEADQLRRAMGAWRKTGVIDKFRAKLIDGMLAKGYEPEFAERLFNQIRGFGEYGFPESHAASFAVLVYVSACLKYYYPAAFTASLLNSQPMGFYAPAQLIRDVRRQGVEVRPIDVGRSDWDCTLEPHEDFQESRRQPIAPWETAAAKQQLALRLGMRLIRGLPHVAAETIVQHRTQRGPFRSVADMTQRCQLSRAVVERLAEADAFGSLKLDRRQALWEALDQPKRHEDLPLWAGKPSVETVRCEPNLPELAEWEQVMADYRTAGLTLRRHPLSFYREELEQLGVTTAEQLTRFSHNQPVKVAGVVLMRQRPSTAKGITFVTLEDESGTINLVIHTHVWDRYDVVARRSQAVIAQGRLERKNEVIHVVVKRLEDMTGRLDQLRIRSRDFR